MNQNLEALLAMSKEGAAYHEMIHEHETKLHQELQLLLFDLAKAQKGFSKAFKRETTYTLRAAKQRDIALRQWIDEDDPKAKERKRNTLDKFRTRYVERAEKREVARYYVHHAELEHALYQGVYNLIEMNPLSSRKRMEDSCTAVMESLLTTVDAASPSGAPEVAYVKGFIALQQKSYDELKVHLQHMVSCYEALKSQLGTQLDSSILEKRDTYRRDSETYCAELDKKVSALMG